MLNIVYFWLPMVLAHTAPAGPQQAENPAGPAWAAAITERAEADWHLRDIESSSDAKGIRISLTLAGEQAAEEISVIYQPSSKSFSAFTQRAIAMPTEEREYETEGLLFEEMSTGGPVAISYDCADFYLDFGSSSVSLAQNDFSVVLWSSGDRPGEALSQWLADSLAGGELIDIRDERVDDGAAVTDQVIFVADTEEGVEEMTVELASTGAPRYLKLRHRGGPSYFGAHPASAALRALASKSPIRRLQFLVDGFDQPPKLQVESGKNRGVALDLSAFTTEGDHCDC